MTKKNHDIQLEKMFLFIILGSNFFFYSSNILHFVIIIIVIIIFCPCYLNSGNCDDNTHTQS